MYERLIMQCTLLAYWIPTLLIIFTSIWQFQCGNNIVFYLFIWDEQSAFFIIKIPSFILKETSLLSEQHVCIERSMPLNKLFSLMNCLLTHQQFLLQRKPWLHRSARGVGGHQICPIRDVPITCTRSIFHVEPLTASHEGLSSADYTTDIYNPPATSLPLSSLNGLEKQNSSTGIWVRSPHVRRMGRQLSMLDYS